MACNCHGRNGVSVGRTSAFDQCTTCARKHVKAAWSKWQEFTYEDDNRDYVSAQLIEEVRDKEFGSIAQELEELRIETRELFYRDYPEAKRRLGDLND